MQSKRTLLMLVMIAVLVVASTGSVGIPIVQGQSAGIDTSVAHLLSMSLPATQYGDPYSSSFSPESFSTALYSVSRDMAYPVPQVSRARSLVSRNENRLAILDFIKANPGNSLSDISRALSMNIGTVRYHLMILAVNHLVVEYNDGARLVRYFTNNGTYTGEQMEIFSLLNREPTSKLLASLSGSQGMTNSKISAASGLQSSDVTRYAKELIGKGIIIKEPLCGDRYQYRIVPELEEFIIKNMPDKN